MGDKCLAIVVSNVTGTLYRLHSHVPSVNQVYQPVLSLTVQNLKLNRQNANIA
ncbi:MAG: hypothetical protein Q9P01_11320 [Anaerolineae bacterium]|nr:hypothetical protein [Anaerolineae bacterium]